MISNSPINPITHKSKHWRSTGVPAGEKPTAESDDDDEFSTFIDVSAKRAAECIVELYATDVPRPGVAELWVWPAGHVSAAQRVIVHIEQSWKYTAVHQSQ